MSFTMMSPDSAALNGGQRPKRARRSRTQFDASAISRLESVFTVERYPDIDLREKLASEIGVSEARIQTWFQNKRSRNRKSSGIKHERAPVARGAKFEIEEQVSGQVSTKTNKEPLPKKTRHTVTDSDIEEMQEIDPAISSDDENSKGFRPYVGAPRSNNRGLHASSYMPNLPVFMSPELYGNYIQSNYGSLRSCYTFGSNFHDVNSNGEQAYSPQTPSSAISRHFNFWNCASSPLNQYFPLTPSSLTPSSATSSPTAHSPNQGPQHFVYPLPGSQSSPPHDQSDICRIVTNQQQMEPLDLSTAPPVAEDEDYYIDICG